MLYMCLRNRFQATPQKCLDPPLCCTTRLLLLGCSKSCALKVAPKLISSFMSVQRGWHRPHIKVASIIFLKTLFCQDHTMYSSCFSFPTPLVCHIQTQKPNHRVMKLLLWFFCRGSIPISVSSSTGPEAFLYPYKSLYTRG